MAKPTSSRTRNRRTASKRPTSSKTRATRSKASNAQVTRSGGPDRSGTQGRARVTRGSAASRTGSGSAKVTGGTKPTPKALPPGKKGGALTRTQRIRRRNINTNNQSNPQTAGGSTAPRGRTAPRATPSVLANVRNQLYVKARQLGINPDRITDRMVKQATMRKLAGATTAAAVIQALLQQVPGPLGRAQRESARKTEEQRTKVQDYAVQKGRRVAEALGLVDRKPSSNKTSSTKPKTSSKSNTTPKKDRLDRDERRTRTPKKDRLDRDERRARNSSSEKTKPSNNKPTKRTTKRTGENDPRNKEYIKAQRKLNANSTKEERDRVRDMGMAIHNKVYGKKTKRTSKKQRRKGRALAIGGYS